MKKKTKIILFAAIGIVVLIAVGVVIGVSVSNSKGSISGTTYVTNYQTGAGIEDWSRYEVDIPFHGSCDTEFYTNEGDYLVFKNMMLKDAITGLRIHYTCSFHIADDFEAFFVLSNMKEGSEERHVITDTEITHWLQYDYIDVPYENLIPNFNKTDEDYDEVREFHIVEIWVRTIL